jgi:hypothetical protein
MVQSKVLIAGAAVAAMAAFALVSQPVQAGSCVAVSAKARGLGEAAATGRSHKKLDRHVNRWAHKNKLTAVRVGHDATACSKGVALAVCTTSAKVCP